MNFFELRVFEAVKLIPKGKVTTYGAIAAYLGNPRACRAVGNALHKNDKPIIVPCHRVVNASGRLARSFVFGGEGVQEELLTGEGVKVTNSQVDLQVYGWYFNM